MSLYDRRCEFSIYASSENYRIINAEVIALGKYDLLSRDVHRILHLFERLNQGELLTKQDLCDEYSVSDKTVQRDIQDLRYYLNIVHGKDDTAIRYLRSQGGYSLQESVWQYQTNQQILATAKILLESRAFPKEEMTSILDSLILSATPSERPLIRNILNNEKYHYQPPHHNRPMLNLIWQLSNAIHKQQMITFSYTRQDGKVFRRTAAPVAILFSEYYFYLISVYLKPDSNNDTSFVLANPNQKYPAILRLDRVQDIEILSRSYYQEYSSRFEEGELRKRIQFMYGGKKLTVKFRFWGSSLQAVLDRLPTAEVLQQNEDGSYIIRAEVYGEGIKMWFFSQMDKLEVLEPKKLREEMREITKRILQVYGEN